MSGGPPRSPAEMDEPVQRKLQDLGLLRRTWPFVRPHARFFILSLGVLFLTIAARLALPPLIGDVATQADHGASALLKRDGLLIAALLLITQLLEFGHTYAMQVVGARSMADLRLMLFERLQRLQLRYLDRTPVGRLVSRITNDVDSVGELFISGVINNALGDVCQLVGVVTMMMLLDWRLSVVAFVSVPVVGVIVLFVRRRSRELYREIRARTAHFNGFFNEQVNGIRVIQALGREEAMAREMEGMNSRFRDASKRAVSYDAVLEAAIEMIGTLCLACVLWWAGFNRIGAHAVSFGLLVTFSQYLRQFFEPIDQLANRYAILQTGLAGVERVVELLDETELDPPVLAPEACGPPGAADEALALEHVRFGYDPAAPVLRDVSLSARKGERIALVGATGAGKTTVASLLLRHYTAQEGVVRVFGRDVRGYQTSELRGYFSVVPQDVFLFPGTVLSNIAMVDDLPDRARAEWSLSRIDALELFEGREGGLDARVDEGGANFSAGERQLLAFARAVYRDAPLLVLDEATASVDQKTEARLHRALEAVLEGRTSLVIAHRLATIRSADRIVVFHQGQVVEVGRHEELLALGGVYARLYRLQFTREEPVQAQAASTGS